MLTMTISPTLGTPNYGGLWVHGWLQEEGTTQQRIASTQAAAVHLGYVYLEVSLDRHVIYLPLVVRDYQP